MRPKKFIQIFLCGMLLFINFVFDVVKAIIAPLAPEREPERVSITNTMSKPAAVLFVQLWMFKMFSRWRIDR